jgi:anti-anti-sigma factor
MIDIKIDTKEKFTVITPQQENLYANMAEELSKTCLIYLTKPLPHLILNLTKVTKVDAKSGEALALLQQKFYENNCSFVICCLNNEVQKVLDENELLEVMNVTPTESEAWDIVQMEEIERELLG